MEDLIRTPSYRASAREFVFGLLFAKAFAPNEDADAVYACELENADAEFGDQIDYVHDTYFGVTDNLAEIDEKIASAAVGWTLSRLSKVSLAIMRLSVYEMMAVNDVPKRVSLNEAVELAKKYDDEKASAFINGVLNSVAKTLPDRDCDLT